MSRCRAQPPFAARAPGRRGQTERPRGPVVVRLGQRETVAVDLPQPVFRRHEDRAGRLRSQLALAHAFASIQQHPWRRLLSSGLNCFKQYVL